MQKTNERIKELRTTLHLTQEEFAKKIGVARTSVTGYETGTIHLTDDIIHKICEQYSVSEHWLLHGVGPIFRPRQTIDNRLAELTGELIAANDTLTKKVIVKYLELPAERRKVINTFLHDLFK